MDAPSEHAISSGGKVRTYNRAFASERLLEEPATLGIKTKVQLEPVGNLPLLSKGF